MAVLLSRIRGGYNRRPIFLKKISGSCCSIDSCTANDYFLMFRTNIVEEDPVPTIEEITGISINGYYRLFDSPIVITGISDLKQLVKEIKFSLFLQSFFGNSFEVNSFDDNTFIIRITDSEAIFDYITTDSDDILFNGSYDSSGNCNCVPLEPEEVIPVNPKNIRAQAYFVESSESLSIGTTFISLHADSLELITTSQYFSINGSNLLEYTGKETAWFSIIMQLNYEQTLSISDLELRIHVNGSPIPVRTYINESNSFDTIECFSLVKLNKGDVIEGMIKRNSGMPDASVTLHDFFIKVD